MLAIIGAVLSIIAALTPFILDEISAPKRKARRIVEGNDAFDKALKEGAAGDIGSLMSGRIDELRAKKPSSDTR